MIARVEQVVLEDRRLGVRDIASKLGISVGSVESILHDEMKMRKVSSSFQKLSFINSLPLRIPIDKNAAVISDESEDEIDYTTSDEEDVTNYECEENSEHENENDLNYPVLQDRTLSNQIKENLSSQQFEAHPHSVEIKERKPFSEISRQSSAVHSLSKTPVYPSSIECQMTPLHSNAGKQAQMYSSSFPKVDLISHKFQGCCLSGKKETNQKVGTTSAEKYEDNFKLDSAKQNTGKFIEENKRPSLKNTSIEEIKENLQSSQSYLSHNQVCSSVSKSEPHSFQARASSQNFNATPLHLPASQISSTPMERTKSYRYSNSSQMNSIPFESQQPVSLRKPRADKDTNSQTFEKNKIIINNKCYAVMALLGRGGSSKVYQIYDYETKGLLALKYVSLNEVDTTIATAFKNEISVLQRLQYSDRVIKLLNYEFSSEDNCIYVVMEKGDVDMSTVIHNYAKGQRITDELIKFYWSEMLKTVLVIHKAGIIHSDLKPANFLLVSGMLKLIDFGIASTLRADMTSVVKDSPVGTLNYISPEAIQDINQTSVKDCSNGENRPQIKINTKSDVWSLGCILYNLVYGRTPFQHINSYVAKLHAIINPKYDIEFPEIPNKQLMDIMKKCLVRNPKERPSIEELLQHPYFTGPKEQEPSNAKKEEKRISATSLLQELETLSPSSFYNFYRGFSQICKNKRL